MIEVIIYSCLGIAIAILVDRVLFSIWHKRAHSNKFRLEEEKQKEIELNEKIDRDREGKEERRKNILEDYGVEKS